MGNEPGFAGGGAIWGDDAVPVRPVGGQASGSEEGAGLFMRDEDPGGDMLGARLTKAIDARIDQARAVSLAPTVGMDPEGDDLSGRLARVGVLAWGDRGEADDLSASAGDQEFVDPGWRIADGLAPPRSERRRLEGRVHLWRHDAVVRLLPDGGLDDAERGQVVQAGLPDAGIGARPTIRVKSRFVPVALAVVVPLPGGGWPAHRPWKTGWRRSPKARCPSARSSLAQARWKASTYGP